MKQAKIFAVIGVVFVLAGIARYQWIEPAAVGELCRALDAPFSCRMRQWLIFSFAHNGLGYAAFVVGALALVTRRTALALLGASLGAAGLVLYCYDFAAVGFLLSVLTLARQATARGDHSGGEHGEGQQHA